MKFLWIKTFYVIVLWSQARAIEVYYKDVTHPLGDDEIVPCTQLLCLCSYYSSSTYCSWVDSSDEIVTSEPLQPAGVYVFNNPKHGDHQYTCMYTTNSNGHSQQFGSDGVTVTCTEATDTPPTSSTTEPATDGTTTPASDSTTTFSTFSTGTPHFQGLNPLIYTSISALFIVVLTVVAIVTCWIRSRKNNRLHALLPQNSPQDYLDYIQEGQFTPLTTSEFVASLRERPPTYNESEVLERTKEEEEGEDPPPLPPRNGQGSNIASENQIPSQESEISPSEESNQFNNPLMMVDEDAISESISHLPILTPIPLNSNIGIVGVVPSLDAVV